jgi:hypothetical protein
MLVYCCMRVQECRDAQSFAVRDGPTGDSAA